MHVQSCWVFSIFFFRQKCPEMRRKRPSGKESNYNLFGGELLWKVINGTRISPGKIPTGKTGLPFQIFTIYREFSRGTPKKRVCVCSIYRHPNGNFLVKETGPLLLLNQCLSFKVQYCCFSKIQLVVHYQCCVLIVWATTRLYVIAH